MKKILVCGFEPFGNDVTNPSWDAVSSLSDSIGNYNIRKLLLPVVFGEAAAIAINEADKISADAVLCIGQAGGRAAITPELVGINLRYAEIPDNRGNKPCDEPVISGGDDARFSTLPVRKMTEAIKSEGIAAKVSYSAGAYVCNDLLYTLLSHFDGSKTGVGFIHVPYSRGQQKEPCMDIEDIVRGISAAIGCLD